MPTLTPFSRICSAPTAERFWAIDPARADYRAQVDPSGAPPARIAVIPIVGVIGQHRSEWNDTGTEDVSAALSAAVADKSTRSIVLYVDSPGGTVTGVPELAEEIFEARQHKKIIAVVPGLAASAGYWIGAAAHQIVMQGSAEVGSIGVFVLHMDLTGALEQAGIKPTFISAGKYKVEGNPFGPLSEEATAHIQARVDSLNGDFIKAVAKFRGVSPAVVKEKFGEGRTFRGREAVALGMADRIGTLGETLDRLGASARNGAMRASLRRERLAERLRK